MQSNYVFAIGTTETSPKRIDPMQNSDPISVSRKLTNVSSYFALGYWFGSVITNTTNDSLVYFQFVRSHYVSTFANDYSLELTSTGQFGASVGLKWLMDLGTNQEPYYKFSLAGLYQPSENLGTFVNWQRYQLRAEVGLEDLFRKNRSLRSQLGISWSGFGIGVYLSGGYAF